MTRTDKSARHAGPAALEVKLVAQQGFGIVDYAQGIAGVETLLLHIAFCTYCGDSPRCLKMLDADLYRGAGEPADSIIVDLGSCPLARSLSEGAPLPTFGTVDEAEVTADASQPLERRRSGTEGHQDFAPLAECYS